MQATALRRVSTLVAVIAFRATCHQVGRLRPAGRHCYGRPTAPRSNTRNSKMSWTCSASSNAQLVDRLREEGILRSPHLVDAMNAVDRGAFLPSPSESYKDAPQLIGYGVTISAPHMHAYCLEYMAQWLKPGAKVLDVGSGSGYLTAVMAHLVSPGGKVVGIEHIGGLVEQSRKNCESLPSTAQLMHNGTLILLEGDGRQGYPEESPFDCIHVGAAAHPFPNPLFDQLKKGGRLVIPLGPQDGQSLAVIEKGENGEMFRQDVMGVRYVPLTSREKQLLDG